MSELVIGEGVALDLRLAKLPSRALAKLLDLLVQFGISMVCVMALGALLSSVDEAVAQGALILMTVAVIIGYPVLLETLTRGRTFGKMALGLRVVRTDGGPVRFRHALVRALTGIFDFIVSVGALAVVTSFCSKDGRRTGDFLAGTVVVRDRTPDSGVTPQGLASLAMPYPLLAWAQAQDLSMLPDDLALAARQYLTRMHELRPEVAARMGYDLMVDVSRYVPPPANVPPWAFLAAVTAERRARQMVKAEAERRAVWEQNQRAQAAAQAAWAAGQHQAGYPQQGYGAPMAGPVPVPVPMPQNPPPQPAAPQDTAPPTAGADEGFRPPE